MTPYRRIKGAKTISKVCPRCSNHVQMMLVRDRGLLVVPLTKVGLLSPFQLKCPICIHVESLTNQQAHSLIGN
jgi:phage FluMu protein Com